MILVNVVTILNALRILTIKIILLNISNIYFYLLRYGVKLPLCPTLKKDGLQYLNYGVSEK